MDRRQLIVGGTALGLAQQVNAASFFNLLLMRTDGPEPSEGNIPVTDRERAQLRGLVKAVVEGESRTEYDAAGNCLSWRFTSPDGSESGASHTYDPDGRLLTTTSYESSRKTVEKSYSYDDKGRLLTITSSDGERTTFAFDKQGQKTETRVVTKRDERAGAAATGIDVMFADIDGSAMLDFRFRDASSFKTIYNDQDQPTETQAYAADGHSLGRVIRTFDDKGRIIGVREIIDDPMSQFPAKALEGMTAQTGVSLDELRAEMAKTFGALQSESGKTYSYDSDGRIEKVILNIGLLGTFTRTYVYNDHGDVIEEHNILVRNSVIPVGVPFHMDEDGKLVSDKPPSEWPQQPDFPAPPDTRCSYTYDSHGNWTEKTITHSKESSVTVRRELTYY